MTEIAAGMVMDSVDSFINGNLEKSKTTLAKDDKIDEIYRKMFKNFDSQLLSEDTRELINIIFIAKSIERLADHAGNIAAIVNYTVTGLKG